MRIMLSRNYTIALVLFLPLLSLGFSLPLRAQSIEGALDESFRAMYNLNFDEALKTAEAAKALDNNDPQPWMAQSCAILFREFERLHILSSELFVSDDKFNSRSAQAWDPEAKKQFDTALNGAERIAQQRLERDKNDLKALFALTIINGLRADDSALIEKKNLTALSYTRSANNYAERLLSLSPGYYDAYIATGMGKYIIGGKAAPVRWMLRIGGFKGDQEQGIKELTLVADHGRYLAPFARILLAFDDLRHKNTVEARKKLVWLNERYPRNTHFTEEMSKLDHPSSGTGQ
jgi:hypothetical protein